MGCTSSKKEIKQVVEHWMGKEIVFPSNLTMKIYGKDTLDYSLLNHKYKYSIMWIQMVAMSAN